MWVVAEVVGAIFYGEDIGASAGDGFLVEGDGAVEGAFGNVAPPQWLIIRITEGKVYGVLTAQTKSWITSISMTAILLRYLLGTGVQVIGVDCVVDWRKNADG